MFNVIAQLVQAANAGRDPANLERRCDKLVEELGEVSEAYLNVTSDSNRKAKTWDDVREELVDCLIVALDIYWTVLPGETEVYAPQPKTEPKVSFIHSGLKAAYHLALYLHSLDLGHSMARFEAKRLVNVVANRAWTRLPDQLELSQEEFEIRLHAEVERKLEKWATKRAAMVVDTDDV
jgi:NTP pyrophosphatase (non-canonical NTP hydrolase)